MASYQSLPFLVHTGTFSSNSHAAPPPSITRVWSRDGTSVGPPGVGGLCEGERSDKLSRHGLIPRTK